MFSSCSAVSAPVCWVLASALLEYLESNLLTSISHSQNWAKSFWEQAVSMPRAPQCP